MQKEKKYFQGKFKPRNPKKYVGDAKNIQYRSGYEFKYMMELDHDPNVLKWASEEMSVKYISPVDRRVHRYFPDFIVTKRTSEGEKVFMIEIKPLTQTKRPNKKGSRKKVLNEHATYMINQAKWKAAEEYCARNGMQFQVLTEKELKIK